MNNIKNITTLGIAGSTSLDGLGLALMETDGIDIYSQGSTIIVPYEETLLERIKKVLGKRDDTPEDSIQIRETELAFSAFVAQTVNMFLEEEQKTVYLGDCTNLDTRMLFVKTILEKEKNNAGEIFVNMNLNEKNPFFREKV